MHVSSSTHIEIFVCPTISELYFDVFFLQTASLSGIAGLNGNNITGQINGLNDLNLELKWSNIGKVHLVLVKVFSLEEMLCCWFATKKTTKTIKQKNIKRKTHNQTK